jgi:hypothetical protein
MMADLTSPCCENCLYYPEDAYCRQRGYPLWMHPDSPPCDAWVSLDTIEGLQRERDQLQAKCEHLERALRLACRKLGPTARLACPPYEECPHWTGDWCSGEALQACWEGWFGDQTRQPPEIGEDEAASVSPCPEDEEDCEGCGDEEDD